MPVDNRKFNHPYILQNPGCADGHIHIHVRVNGDKKIETIYVRLYTRYSIVVLSLIKRLKFRGSCLKNHPTREWQMLNILGLLFLIVLTLGTMWA